MQSLKTRNASRRLGEEDRKDAPMRLIADRPQLRGVYGIVTQGQAFNCPPEVARELIRMGHAHEERLPQVIIHETKKEEKNLRNEGDPAREVTGPDTFRDVPVSHEEQAPVAPEGNRVLPQPNIHEPRAVDRGRRRKRSGSRSR